MGQLMFKPLFPSYSDMLKEKEGEEEQIKCEKTFNNNRYSRLILIQHDHLFDLLKKEAIPIKSREQRTKAIESAFDHFISEYSSNCINHLLNVVERNLDKLTKLNYYGSIDFEMELMFSAGIRKDIKSLNVDKTLKKFLKKLEKVELTTDSDIHFSKYFNAKEYIVVPYFKVLYKFDKEFKCLENAKIVITDFSLKNLMDPLVLISIHVELIDLERITFHNNTRVVILFTDVEFVLNNICGDYSFQDPFRPELSELCEWNGFRGRISLFLSILERSYKCHFEYHLLNGKDISSVMNTIIENLESNGEELKTFVSPNLVKSNFVNRKISFRDTSFSDIVIILE